jgi:uncharacterized damage-inducible protein DinB
MNPEQAKAAADVMIDMWGDESRATCQVLAAVGRGNRDYKPDAKSRTAWEIATHLATADIWFIDSIINGKFVWDEEGAKKAEAQFKSASDIETFYNKTFPERLKALRALSSDTLVQPMSFFGMFEWPRVRFIGFANNHSVHHRGQLAAYLRAMGSKVPDIYGPSADSEKKAAAATT